MRWGSKGWGLISPPPSALLGATGVVRRGGEGGGGGWLGEGAGDGGTLDVVPASLGRVVPPPGRLHIGDRVHSGDSSDDVNDTAGGDEDDDDDEEEDEDEDADNFSPER